MNGNKFNIFKILKFSNTTTLWISNNVYGLCLRNLVLPSINHSMHINDSEFAGNQYFGN